MATIADLHAHEILDSRGTPTLSVTVHLGGGLSASAAVPSGSSTGEREAEELRDGDARRYRGRGVLKAAAAVRDAIAPRLRGLDPSQQGDIDRLLRRLDGTPRKSRLGANAILGTSLAVARAAALAENLPLYAHLGHLAGRAEPPGESVPYVLPLPMIAVINGGAHANNTLDIQEFMLCPVGAPSFAEAVRWGAEIFQALKDLLARRGLSTAVGDAGGFAPDIEAPEKALHLIVEAIEAAGFKPGGQVGIALDLAASGLVRDGRYRLRGVPGAPKSAAELIEMYRSWSRDFPLLSIEDGVDEHDRGGWQSLTRALGGAVQLVGDDVFVTSPALLSAGIKDGIANAVLVKPNQVGTLSETLETIRVARENGMAAVVAGRSGETEDTFIADLAVGTGAGQIKTGSLCRSERLAKYNRLLAIERDLGAYAVYGGRLFRRKTAAA